MRRPKVERPICIGLDLSLRAAGICVIEPEWEPGEWDRIHVRVAGYDFDPKVHSGDAKDKIERLSSISDAVVEVVSHWSTVGPLAIGVEDYAWGMLQGAQYLGEVGGVVKVSIFRSCGIVPLAVNSSSWRKLLLGLGRGKGIKAEVHRRLKIAEVPKTWTGDCMDAMGVANFVRSEHGLSALTFAQ
jgi:hypothetical protein